MAAGGDGLWSRDIFQPRLVGVIGAVCCRGAGRGGYLVIIGWRDHAMLPWMVLFLCVALGGAAGMLRSYLISAPVLSYPYYGDIIGRVVQVDRSNSNAPRYTLDQLTLGPIPAHKTPHKIRVSVHDKTGASDAHIGDIIKVRGYISPPPRSGGTLWI